MSVFLLIEASVGGICLCLSYKYLWLVALISPLMQFGTALYMVVLISTSIFGEITDTTRENQWNMLWFNYVLMALFLNTGWLKQTIFRMGTFIATWHFVFLQS